MFKGVGNVYLHSVVDNYGSSTSVVPGIREQLARAASVLYNDALAFYQEHEPAVTVVLTDHGQNAVGGRRTRSRRSRRSPICGAKRTKVRRRQTNSFVERCQRTVLDERSWVPLRTTQYESPEALLTQLDEWPPHCNRGQLQLGYRSSGKRPYDSITAYPQNPPLVDQAAVSDEACADSASKAMIATTIGNRPRHLLRVLAPYRACAS